MDQPVVLLQLSPEEPALELGAEVADVRVESAEGSRFAVFHIRISLGGNQYDIFRRYSSFREFHRQMSEVTPLPALPPKALFGNMSPSFLETRRRDLNRYLARVLSDPRITSTATFRSFLCLPSDTKEGLDFTKRTGGLEGMTYLGFRREKSCSVQ